MPDTSSPAFEPATVERPAQFSCRLTHTETESQLALTGELDIATVPQLDRALCRAAADAALVILDLRELEFIDSSGAHLLLAAHRRIRRSGGRLVVAIRIGADVECLLALTGIGQQLELVDRPPAGATAPTLAGSVPA